MKLLEIMERTGIRDTKKAIAYVKDALIEIEELSKENVDRKVISVSADQRLYSLPGTDIQILGVYQKASSDASKYVLIPRAISIDVLEDDSTTNVAGLGDEIIIY